MIDIKEPHRGALGMADDATIRDVLVAVSARVPTSIALGELQEANAAPRLAQLPTYAKFGLAGAGRDSAWHTSLQDAIGSLPPGVQAVAVAYADWRPANAPAPQEVLKFAAELGCRGLLFDTFVKSGGSLVEHLAAAELRGLLDEARGRGLITVLAGGLKLEDLVSLAPLEPDYFGFRGAVCRGGREAILDPELVRKLRQLLRGGEASEPLSLARNRSLRVG